jgi:hypothetical protein
MVPAVFAGALGACARPISAPSLTLDQLADAQYDSPAPAEGVVRLTDGEYSGEAAPGAASAISVSLLPELVALGDLDGDGLVDAAVVLAGSAGGSGTFISLAAVKNEDGAPLNVATALLGDRVRVSSVAIHSGELVVELTQHAPTDPLCCPSLETVRRFRLEHGSLIEIGAPS